MSSFRHVIGITKFYSLGNQVFLQNGYLFKNARVTIFHIILCTKIEIGLVDKFSNSVQISLNTLLFLKLVNVSVVTYHSSEKNVVSQHEQNLHYFKVKSYNLV